MQFHGGMIATIRALTGSDAAALLRRHVTIPRGRSARPEARRRGASSARAWSTRSGSTSITPARLQGRAGAGGDGRLPVRLRRDGAGGRRLDVRGGDAHVRDRSAICRRSSSGAIRGRSKMSARGCSRRSVVRSVAAAVRRSTPAVAVGLSCGRHHAGGPHRQCHRCRKLSTVTGQPRYPFTALVGQETTEARPARQRRQPAPGRRTHPRPERYREVDRRASVWRSCCQPIDVVDNCRFGCDPQRRQRDAPTAWPAKRPARRRSRTRRGRPPSSSCRSAQPRTGSWAASTSSER